jgi:hypothetical protein
MGGATRRREGPALRPRAPRQRLFDRMGGWIHAHGIHARAVDRRGGAWRGDLPGCRAWCGGHAAAQPANPGNPTRGSCALRSRVHKNLEAPGLGRSLGSAGARRACPALVRRPNALCGGPTAGGSPTGEYQRFVVWKECGQWRVRYVGVRVGAEHHRHAAARVSRCQPTRLLRAGSFARSQSLAALMERRLGGVALRLARRLACAEGCARSLRSGI